MQESTPNENKPLIVLHTGHFRNKLTSSVSFIVASLLFLLPFMNIKCNDTKLMSATGLQLAVGFKVKPSSDMNALTRGILGNDRRNPWDDESTSTENTDSYGSSADAKALKQKDVLPPNYFLLMSMIMTVVASVISFIPFKKRWMFCYIAGWISVVGFLITIIWATFELKQYSVNLGQFLELSINFTLWFYLAILAVVAGSLFSHAHANREWAAQRKKEIEAYMQECGYKEEPVIIPEQTSAPEVL